MLNRIQKLEEGDVENCWEEGGRHEGRFFFLTKGTLLTAVSWFKGECGHLMEQSMRDARRGETQDSGNVVG